MKQGTWLVVFGLRTTCRRKVLANSFWDAQVAADTNHIAYSRWPTVVRLKTVLLLVSAPQRSSLNNLDLEDKDRNHQVPFFC